MTVVTLLSKFDLEMANTRKILECVPEAKFVWAPHEKSTTLGRLANHLAAIVSEFGTHEDGTAEWLF